jgi:excinuclease ABC subunit A
MSTAVKNKQLNLSAPLKKDDISIKGARVHNLKNVSVQIPRNKFIVVTGVSGSGKSSLTIDTLYAEGQRRYAESLSAYARQFLNRMNKPDVDYIKGLCPAIAIEQKVITRTPRSTVGSMTEIYDYMRLLFARVGKTISPVSGREVKKDDVTDIVNTIQQCQEGSKILLLVNFPMHAKRSIKEELNILIQKGFTRVYKKINAGKTKTASGEMLVLLHVSVDVATGAGWVGQQRLRDRPCDQQRFGGIAGAQALRLGVFEDS